MGHQHALLVALLLLICGSLTQYTSTEHKINGEIVNNWANKFGNELWTSLTVATRRDTIQKRYDEHTAVKVEKIWGHQEVRKMAQEVQIMMQHKMDAIKRIMELAENIAFDARYDNKRGDRLKDGRYTYRNAKKLNVVGNEDECDSNNEFECYLSQYRDRNNDELYAPGYTRMQLTANKHFSGIPVNTSFSSVHVPTNVYDGDPKVINAIEWSKLLDDTFRDNYERDPSLSWQCFGSTTGFLRQYPAMKWLMYEDDPDMYDARMRDWYIKSAASSKDVIILLDVSGSMTGLRKEIAKHVVINIMETLSEDDYLTVLKFADETTPLVPCFTNADGEPELVQATNENIAIFTEAVNKIETQEIANFSSALISAFDLHNRYKTSKEGAESNKAIMLVTDGVPYTYETIFQEHNWKEGDKKEHNQPNREIRVFTYLIGREISDLEAAKWMACQNKGYFTHVTTLAEVKEQVLKYIPVMARPMVLQREIHPIRWTGVYADIEVPNQRSLWVIGLAKPTSRRKIHEAQEKEGTFKGYKLMTSVSIPVYNKKNHTSIDELGIKPNEIANPFGQVRIAELLGVAGTDVPIAEIEKLIPPYKLGVNGYSFAINNNGYILYHPDLRPMFQEILKPNYNSVDLAEVELIHDPAHPEPRWNDSTLYNMRKNMVDQLEGEEQMMVKVHLDDMKRVTIRQQDYFYHTISNTPFTLGIAFPSEYGKYRVSGGMEINQNKNANFDPTTTFAGDNWKLHPDWVYCEYNYAGNGHKEFDSPETNMRHFLKRINKDGLSWGNDQRVRPLPKCENSRSSYQADCPKCDKELVQALVTDGEITKIFESDEARPDLFNLFGIDISFVATRSGLTRWEEHKEKPEFGDVMEYDDMYDNDNPREPHFSEVNNKAIDEVWYKRAVDYHYNNPTSFVFSVPFDIGDKRPTTVTATHAIFKEMGGIKAPAAVVGVQIDYDKFTETFKKITEGDENNSGMSCKDEAIECYVLDNNGFVVISEDPLNTGTFFGEIDGTILNSLEEYQVFNKIKIYDYQAICLEREDDGSPASGLLTPFRLLATMFNYLLGQLAMTIIRLELHHLWNPDWTWARPQDPATDYAMDNEAYDYDAAEYQYYSYDDAEQNPPDNVVEQPSVEVTDGEGDDDDDDEATVEQPKDPYDAFNEEILKEYKMKDGGPIPLLEMTYINKTRPKPCDKEVYLYELNETALAKQTPLQGILRNCHESNCERPFSATMIPNTNLVLVVADKNCPCYSTKISVEPAKVEYGFKNESSTNYCHILKSNLYRKKPHEGFHYHPGEDEISLCGHSDALLPTVWITVISMLFLRL